MPLFDKLEPKELWAEFEKLLAIPRPSDQEEKIQEYLIQFAISNQLQYYQDKTGNIIITKPASIGLEDKPILILQSHMDMVCEKNADTSFDFLADPIPAYRDGDWIKSRGTTLGADDGIGMAAQLAILKSQTLAHGPLECLFTVAEETGLSGAFGLEPGVLKGKILLNLDSEDDGEIFIGCAGGIDVSAWLDYMEDPVPENHLAMEIALKGLKGGHSGDEIHKALGNSIKLLNRFLWEYSDEFGIRIHSFEGGNLRNAIPREAFAQILIPRDLESELANKLKKFETTIQSEYAATEPNLKLSHKKIPLPQFVLDEDTQSNLLNGLYACPHGVYAWSQTMANMVETSTNLAAVKFENGRIAITTSQRSSIRSAILNMANMVESVFILAGADTSRNTGYPGWNPNPDSALVKTTAATYQDLFGNQPAVRAIHAGLECGLFLEKYPDLEMVSFGPTIRGAHSPDERLHIPATQKFYLLLTELLLRL